jgi:hypothetical protein
MPIYAREHVTHIWLVDPARKDARGVSTRRTRAKEAVPALSAIVESSSVAIGSARRALDEITSAV